MSPVPEMGRDTVKTPAVLWNRFPREAVDALSLEVLNARLDGL